MMQISLRTLGGNTSTVRRARGTPGSAPGSVRQQRALVGRLRRSEHDRSDESLSTTHGAGIHGSRTRGRSDDVRQAHDIPPALLAATMLVIAARVGNHCPRPAGRRRLVNGEPITALDIEQRSKLTQISTQKTPPRQEVIDELINEKLKVREAKKWGLEVTTSEVDRPTPRWRAACGLRPNN